MNAKSSSIALVAALAASSASLAAPAMAAQQPATVSSGAPTLSLAVGRNGVKVLPYLDALSSAKMSACCHDHDHDFLAAALHTPGIEDEFSV